MTNRSVLAGVEVPIIGSDSIQWLQLTVTSTTPSQPPFAPPTEDAAACSVIGTPPSYLIWFESVFFMFLCIFCDFFWIFLVFFAWFWCISWCIVCFSWVEFCFNSVMFVFFTTGLFQGVWVGFNFCFRVSILYEVEKWDN